VEVLARAFDQIDYYRLKQIGIEYVVKETYFSALELGCLALLRLGIDEVRAEKLKKAFTQVENEMVGEMYQSWVSSDDSGMSPGYRELFMQQEATIRDAMQSHQGDEDEQ
jgi:CPA2 family monovalent cation:H+ antiporter-2/glutathione-regulated potassium-efflux system ancillary protein KefC